MSATTGTVACSAMVLSASASSRCGTATRTMSTPAATSDAICWSVALTSDVLVVVIDWMLMGASPPTSTEPTRSFRDFLRSFNIGARSALALVQHGNRQYPMGIRGDRRGSSFSEDVED